MNEIISRRVNEKLNDLPREKNFAVVLKGVSLNFVEENFREDLEAAKDDPLNYFLRLRSSGRKFFTHEEFLLLSALIFMQYDGVCVLNNNLFMAQYLIAAELTGATKKILLDLVNCRYGYDVRCEVVCEEGCLTLPEPANAMIRTNDSRVYPICHDWSERFPIAYDVEFQDFINSVKAGRVELNFFAKALTPNILSYGI